MDDTGYRRVEDGAAVPRRARGIRRHWLPGVALAVAFLLSFAIWAVVIFAVIRFWHRF